ncbi:MAG TPA: hypothetical protein VGK67_20585 [Myxococcales bacterium]|jgi:hypothetical protein
MNRVAILALSSLFALAGCVEKESAAHGYTYAVSSSSGYLELDKADYRDCDILVDGDRPSLWTNSRTKLKPGSHEVRCEAKMGSRAKSPITIELPAGRVYHVTNWW